MNRAVPILAILLNSVAVYVANSLGHYADDFPEI